MKRFFKGLFIITLIACSFLLLVPICLIGFLIELGSDPKEMTKDEYYGRYF